VPEPRQIEWSWFGFEGKNAAAVSYNNAIRHGVRMAALAGNIWPRETDRSGKFREVVAKELLEEISVFAVNVRRVMELSGAKGVAVDRALLTNTAANPKFEADLWRAVNTIIHARRIVAHFIEVKCGRYANLDEERLTHVEVESAERTISVCPVGMLTGFTAVDYRREYENKQGMEA
jgi:hypothetical protein